MASNQTANFGLNQWAPEDSVVREEFNADNAKIDAALGGIFKVSYGTYTGNGAAERVISLPFTPKLVFVCQQDGATRVSPSSIYHYGGLALEGTPATTVANGYGLPIIKIQGQGFLVYQSSVSFVHICTNESNAPFHYFALG